jgi:hypothetical protein
MGSTRGHSPQLDGRRHSDHSGRSFGNRDAQDHAEYPTDQREENGLHQELEQDVAAPRPERLANADLSRPLGDGNEHDIHDHDPTDDQRDRGNADHRAKKSLAEPGPNAQKTGIRFRGETVGFARQVMASSAQDDTHLINRRVELRANSVGLARNADAVM